MEDELEIPLIKRLDHIPAESVPKVGSIADLCPVREFNDRPIAKDGAKLFDQRIALYVSPPAWQYPDNIAF